MEKVDGENLVFEPFLGEYSLTTKEYVNNPNISQVTFPDGKVGYVIGVNNSGVKITSLGTCPAGRNNFCGDCVVKECKIKNQA